MQEHVSEPLWREDEYASYVGVSVRTAQVQRQRGDGPPYVRLSRRAIRYRKRDVDIWVSEQTRTNTSQP